MLPTPPLKKNKKGEIRSKKAIPLAQKQERYNAAVKGLRARVENTFGEMKHKFEALQKPWGETDEQLDNLVFLAVGVCNAES